MISMQDVLSVIHRHSPKDFHPKMGIILGSGLSSVAEQLEHAVSIPFQAIPGVQAGAVSGHSYLLMMGYLNGIPVVCLRGRLHLYEGTPYDSIAVLIRLIKQLGCSNLFITAAAGSLSTDTAPGELMMINDHINFHPGNPLVGANDESIGPRFVAMEDAYDHNLRAIMKRCATQLGFALSEGVYISTLGPSFETPAEIRAFRAWGADAVGMSVVPEVILARHAGLRVACVAAITNLGAGMSSEKLSHEGTLHFGQIAAHKLSKLVPLFVKEAVNAMA